MRQIILILLNATVLVLSCSPTAAQANITNSTIREAVEKRQWSTAKAELERLRTKEPAVFRDSDYDYLLARIEDQSGDLNRATASYDATISNGSLLSQYSLWHLARIARSSGDLVLERERLRKLLSL